jgi:hypothetical protein
MNQILEINIINGRILIIILGIKILVITKGTVKETLRFLKNSTSSNKFNIIPNE